MNNHKASRHVAWTADASAADDLAQLLAGPVDATAAPNHQRIDGAVVGTLVGFRDGGAIALVTYREQPAAVPARATIDLYGPHVGRQVVLMFDEGDPRRPIVVGCLREPDALALPAGPEHVEIDADGRRLVVSAKERIVLRCGKASITLTREGKLILQGEYVSNHSSGVLRLKGGSVQIN